MTIGDQLDVLARHRVEHVVVGGQAGVLRQAIEFSHDLDILIAPAQENASRLRAAIREVTSLDPTEELLLGRDFQQYVHPTTGEELDVHLKLLAIPDFPTGLANSSRVEFLGRSIQCLELPALYASKRTDRPRDAVHRRAIEDRLASLVLTGEIEPDEVILSVCLDARLSALPDVRADLDGLARATGQPLLQMRLLALGHGEALAVNPHLHATVRSVLGLDPTRRAKILQQPARLAALLARLGLLLPPSGYHPRPQRRADPVTSM